ncbi:N-6 DNA methylase [Alteromonas sp. HB246098]
MKQQIFHSVIEFFRKKSGLDSRDASLVSQGLFLWLKMTKEEKLGEEELYLGFEDISERFEQFIYKFCDGYKYTLRKQLKLTDDALNALVDKISGALDRKLITYYDVAEIAFELSLNNDNFGTQLPNELVALACDLLTGEMKDIYCPFTASYRFAEQLSISGNDVYYEPSTINDIAFPKLSADLKDANYHQEWLDSNPVTFPIYIGKNGLRQFSHTIALPPFGLKYPKDTASSDMFGRFPEQSLMGEVLQLRHMLSQTSEQLVTFVISGFLSRTAAGEKQFKQDMIKQGMLHAVIALPDKLFNTTAIPVNILVFDKRKKAKHVLFIDASSEHFFKKDGRQNVLNNISDIICLYRSEKDAFLGYANPSSLLDLAVHVSPEEISNNDFNLLPSRYVLSSEQKQLNQFLDNHDTIALSDFAELISTQAIKDEMDGDATFYEYGLTNLNDIGELLGEGKKVATNTHVKRAQNQILQKNDILIVNKGSVGKIAFVEELPSENAMPSQAFTIVRINKRVSDIEPVALFQYLLSPMGQLQLESMATGVTVTMIGTKDLKNMRIPVFSQQQTEEAYQRRNKVKQLHNQLFEIEHEIKQLNHKNWVN